MRFVRQGSERAIQPPPGEELEEIEIVELDADPPRSPSVAVDALPEQPYLRDRRDPTGTSGIWRAIEAL